MIRHNHLAVWVSVILAQALGALTYMVLLIEPWKNAQTARQKEFADMEAAMKNGTAKMDMEFMKPFIMDLIGTILLCYFISWLVNKLNITTTGGGFMLGVYIGLGVVIKAVAGHYYFLGIGDTVTVIDTCFTMVVVVMVSTIIGAWRKKGAMVA
jgi:hypothetical protein